LGRTSFRPGFATSIAAIASSISLPMLGELIDLVSGIAMGEQGYKAKDILGRVYEYFLFTLCAEWNG
jgi:hypothetical protein